MRLSIIIPIYNSDLYLKDALDSLINGTYKNLEIIVIDDASTDQSLDILKLYAQKFPDKIKLIVNNQNLGQSMARNKGLEVATGDYIGFLDSDDFVHPKMYEVMIEEARNNNYPDVISVGLAFVRNNNFLLHVPDIYRQPKKAFNVLENPKLILNESPSVCSHLFKRETITCQFLENKMWEDVAFTFSHLFNANRVLQIPGSYYYYRKKADSGVSSKGFVPNKHLLDIFDVADKILIETKKQGRYETLKPQIKFIQIATCLQRASEVLYWDIDPLLKADIINKLNETIKKKYGDWEKIPIEQLSTRVGIMELEKIKEIVNSSKTLK